MKLRLLMVFVLLSTAMLVGQTFRGTILGSVSDPSGAAVAVATVKVRKQRSLTRAPASVGCLAKAPRQKATGIARNLRHYFAPRRRGGSKCAFKLPTGIWPQRGRNREHCNKERIECLARNRG